MYVELLDGRNVGKIRDLDNGTALDLIKLGRAKRAFGEPTDAAPVLAGGYRGTTNAKPGFASGGTVESKAVLVGETVTDDTLPRHVAEKLTGKKKK